MCKENWNEIIDAKYLNRPFICFNDLLSKSKEQEVIIVASYMLWEEAYTFLQQYELEHLLEKVEWLDEILQERQVVVYGTAMNAEWQYKKYCGLMNVIGFCDSKEEKWGNLFCDKEIISPQKLGELEQVAVLIASNSWKEIGSFLQSNKYASCIYVDWHWLVMK